MNTLIITTMKLMKNSFLLALILLFGGTAGYAKNNVTEDDAKSAEKVEAVDLGLSVKWANMNVGAKSHLASAHTSHGARPSQRITIRGTPTSGARATHRF